MKKVLIIDDDPVFCEIVRDKLITNYSIVVANDGVEGMKYLNRERFDIVITDILLPGRDGFEITQHITKEYPETKIIAVSGGGEAVDSESYLELAKRFGAQSVYSKHSPITRLTALVNEIF